MDTIKCSRFLEPSVLRSEMPSESNFLNAIGTLLRPFKSFFDATNVSDDEKRELKTHLKEYLEAVKTIAINDPDSNTFKLSAVVFWSNQKWRWPKLSILSLGILSMPTSGADVEGSFSVSKYYLGDRKFNFKSVNLEEHLQLYQNKPSTGD